MSTSVASLPNGHANGISSQQEVHVGLDRFSDIPRAIDIPVSTGDGEEAVEVDLEELLDDPTELCTLLENENVAKRYWVTIALAYAKQNKVNVAIEIVKKGLGAVNSQKPDEKLGLYNILCWLYLLKSREAPRMVSETETNPDVHNKDFYLRAATSTLNDASRINPSYSPLYLARGTLCLLRAALQSQPNEKADTLRQAVRAFDDALRTSAGKNMMALLGKSRTLYSLGQYNDACKGYQDVLKYRPDLTDPDPRIGIGCCFWQAGYKDEAKSAWARSLELNPESKIANILLGLYHLNSSAHYSTTDPQFTPLYKKAMVQYTQKAFKLDPELPLACSTFGSYFLVRKAMPKVESLARKAIERTDVNAIASDGWYLLARKEHYEDELARATEFYSKADQARGGDEKGYLPAKFGLAQLKVLQGDSDGAKFRLERMVQQTKSVEAMTLLGTLFAEDVFNNAATASKEEQATAAKRAVGLLEMVRLAWKDPKKNLQPDSSLLLNLARLYELDSPEKSLQCLQQVEQIEIDELPEDIRSSDEEDEAVRMRRIREQLPPQLLNNIACFHFNAERYDQSKELFETALDACKLIGSRDSTVDTDALVTTISFNLARTYEAQGLFEQAKTVFEGLLERHEDYTDARTRLAYISLRQNPGDEGPKMVSKLFESEGSNLEVRSLYGWYLRKGKRKTQNLQEDQEQRHHRHTLQYHDKYDRYALTAMGNLHLTTAREMRRDTSEEKERRRRSYEKAVEFFAKALQLDPRNAYAAQGIGIAMVEDKKDYSAALQIFTKVRETVKEPSVYVNLGHVYCELKQFSRAIENYEMALAKDRARDPQILACLGRAWLLRGKQEKSIQAMRNSLDYSQRALEVAPDQIHFRFNVAFVQIQIAQLLYNLPESQRTLEEVTTAAAGLDAAIEAFLEIAKAPNPPFPRGDIESRANMGRNTMRRQLERAVQSQREYEERNAERLAKAREAREQELQKRKEAEAAAAEAHAEKQRKIMQDRQEMMEKDREMLAERATKEEEERRRKEEEFSIDEETGEQRKKKPKRQKRKKKTEHGDEDGEDGGEGRASSGSPGAEDRPRKKKKRRLERRGGRISAKVKSSEFVVDSDEDDVDMEAERPEADASGNATPDEGNDAGLFDEDEDDAMGSAPNVDGDSPAPAPLSRKKVTRVLDDEDEDEDEDADGMADAPRQNGNAVGMEDDDED